ncbi:ALP1-like protein isoform X1 [Tanacetum coccineum]
MYRCSKDVGEYVLYQFLSTIIELMYRCSDAHSTPVSTTINADEREADRSFHIAHVVVRPDATGVPGFSVIMKCTCAIRQLAYGVTPDSLDEYLQMGSHCARDCLDFFTMCVIELFMPKYLRKPDFNDIQKLYTAHNNIHGFPGMLGSIDCMHWEWRNCPKAWHGQFGRGDKKYPTILLEAVASYDLWIWHAFFGVAGANNDLTVLNNSPLFDDLLDGIDPVAPFECNGVTFEKGYYLADGIYPQWASFVKSFTVASSEKNVLYKRKQEGARKDIERAFGVLQGRTVQEQCADTVPQTCINTPHSHTYKQVQSDSNISYTYLTVGIPHFSFLRRSLVLGQPQDEANASVAYISGTRRTPAHSGPKHSQRCEDLIQQIGAIRGTLSQSTGALE